MGNGMLLQKAMINLGDIEVQRERIKKEENEVRLEECMRILNSRFGVLGYSERGSMCIHPIKHAYCLLNPPGASFCSLLISVWFCHLS